MASDGVTTNNYAAAAAAATAAADTDKSNIFIHQQSLAITITAVVPTIHRASDLSSRL